MVPSFFNPSATQFCHSLFSCAGKIYHELPAIYCLIDMRRNLLNFSSKFLLYPIQVKAVLIGDQINS
uniref:DEAD-box ATP-dependent RNA helicase 8-like n=1 Tax=Rhizophora mucronata TaxID=61149 RepID=A0A2P2LB47_RHIMU